MIFSKKTLFGFLLFLFVTASSAQVTSITISGLVRNKADKEPISYVNIVVKEEKQNTFVAGTITNETGRFSIMAIKPGN